MPKPKTPPPPARIRLKKDDVVRVIAGRDKGKEGRVLSVDRLRGKVYVEGVMLVKRHTRPNPARQIKGGIAEREGPIDVSNVMILGPQGPVRITIREEKLPGGKVRRTRVCPKTGQSLDAK